MLAALSADDAETRLRKGFDRQFGHADGEIRAAAQALGLPAVNPTVPTARDDRRPLRNRAALT